MLEKGDEDRVVNELPWEVRKKPGNGHRVYIYLGQGSWFRIGFYNDSNGAKALKVAHHIVNLHNESLKKNKDVDKP